MKLLKPHQAHDAIARAALCCATFVLAFTCLEAVAQDAAEDQPKAAAAPQNTTRLEVIEFRQLRLDEAMRILSQQAGLKIVPSSKAAAVPISLYLQDVAPADAIEAMCKAHGLWYRQDPATGIYRIHTVEEYQRDLTAFRDEQSQVFTLLYPNAVDIAHAISDLYGDRVVLGLGADEQDEFDELEQRFDRFDLLDERSEGLGTFNSEFGSAASRFGSSSSRFNDSNSRDRFDRRRNRTSGLSDLAELHRQREALQRQELDALTAEQIQALEAAAAQGDAIDRSRIDQILAQRRALIHVTVLRRQNRIVIRTSDERIMEELSGLVRKLDVPTPMVLLEVKVLSILLGDGFDSAFDFSFQAGEASGSFSTGEIGSPPAGSFLPGGTGLISPEAAIIQYVGNQFQARLQLLESENRVTRLATPLILTANNEVSRIFAGDTVPIVVGFSEPETIVTEGGSITIPGSPETELRDVGTSLLITPNINADRTVTLRILQETSEVIPDGATIPVPTGNGSINEQSIDTVRRRALTGTIVAKDGVSAAVSGLIEESISSSEDKFPVLGDIPIIDLLFKRVSTDQERRELVILIRPYVMTTPAEAEGISEQLLNELSIHPTAGHKRGTLDTFSPDDVPRSDEPTGDLHKRFRFHSVPGDRE